ncbi:MAG: endolytic transglycosylase MltG [Patescibacteria group bacterium]|nr:endolytic transglycosylase MltG [Patescibacteria group bacterium]MCL5432007.1 endolytic transglycosylase MltG [Patescibacteria group bacterium]
MTRPLNTKTIILSISGIILLTLTAIGLFAYFSLFGAPQSKAESERFIVSLNESKQDVIKKLHEQKFIKSERGFNYVLKENDIQPGGYKISKSMTAWELASAMKEPYMKWVVIPEGLRKEQIADVIGEALGWSEQIKKDFVTKYTAMAYDQLEGIYFPDTYLLPKDETALQISDRLRAKFNEKFKPYADKFVKANIKWDTALKIASIVQREAAGKSDMPLVAGILWNRLLKDMKLEADDTIQYIRDDVIHYSEARFDAQPKDYTSVGSWWTPIKLADKQIESPYNTYRNKGLPPHPICNPGLDAIDAVLNSADTECLYYLHDSNGQIHCAKTYEEHQANIEKYLK